MQPIVIPMAFPGAEWSQQLLEHLLALRDLKTALAHPASFNLCIFCMTPVGPKEAVLIFANNHRNPWVLELPDGQRLSQPPIPDEDLFFSAICKSCAKVIHPWHDDPEDVAVMSCSRCGIRILVPSWRRLSHHWRSTALVEPLGHQDMGFSTDVYLCLSCWQYLWRDTGKVPYFTQPPEQLVCPLDPNQIDLITYRLDHPPMPLPVVYDPDGISSSAA